MIDRQADHPAVPTAAGVAVVAAFAVVAIVFFWLLMALDVDVEGEIFAASLLSGALAIGAIASSIFVLRDSLNPVVQLAGYVGLYFAFAFVPGGSALTAASVVAFLAWTALGVVLGAKFRSIRPRFSLPLLSTWSLRLALVAVVAVSVLAFAYVVQHLGGIVAYLGRSYELSFIAREEGLEVFFLPGLIVVAVACLWLVYLDKGLLFASILAIAFAIAVLSFRRANVFFLLMAVVMYWHYFVRKLRPVVLVPLGITMLALMLIIGTARLGGVDGSSDMSLLASAVGLDSGLYEVYRFILGTRLDYDFLARSGSSIQSGLQFLLPSFLVDRGDYQTIPEALATAVHGAFGYGTPASLFGSMLIYLPPALAPLFAIIPGWLWGNVYGGLRSRNGDRGAFLWYLASAFIAFDLFRTGDIFHSAKIGVLIVVTLLPVTFLMGRRLLVPARVTTS